MNDAVQMDSIRCLQVRRLNGSYVSDFKERTIAGLTSIASGSNKCFHYNLTGNNPVKELKFNITYYKIGGTVVYGFLILTNRARNTGKS